MQNDERISQTMKAVVFYSNTGQSAKIATFLAEKLNFPEFDIFSCEETIFTDLAIVFPVLCQNVPDPIKKFLSNVTAERLSIIATYGRIDHGNVINEAKKFSRGKLVAAAYIPTKHTYLDEPCFNDFDALLPLVEKIKLPSTEINVPKSKKNFFADIFPAERSRLGVKIIRTDACSKCGVCTINCPNHAILNGVTNKKCIRCLKCVQVCPFHALQFKLSAPLKIYLRKKTNSDVEIFV